MKMPTTRFFLVALVAAYFFLPLFVRESLGPNFYVYSVAQDRVSHVTVLFGLLLLALAFLVTMRVPSRSLYVFPVWFLRLNFAVSIAYCIFLAIYGFRLRVAGVGRIDLLTAQSQFMLPGVGIFLMFACIWVLHEEGWRNFFIFSIACLAVDYVFMGKIYTFILASMAVVKWDLSGKKFNFFRAILMVIGASLFLFLTYYLRAFSAAAGEASILIDAYSVFSEFVGVQASVGWAADYIDAGRVARLADFSSLLRDYYIGSVGHGLAISPAAYFYANFNSFWILISIAFVLTLLFILEVGAGYFGPIFLFTLTYNFQHLMRHGPDIFIEKFVSQIFVLLFVFVVLGIFAQFLKRFGGRNAEGATQ